LKLFLAISRGIDTVATILGKIMWWLTLFMVLIGAYNVITRYAFGVIARLFGEGVAHVLSGNVYLEMQTYAYNLVFLLGAAYVFKADAHVRVDIIYSNLSRKAKAWVDIFGSVFFLIPFSLLGIFFSQSYVARSWRQLEVSPNPGGLARYPIKTIIVIAFALLITQAISEIIKNIAFLRDHPDSGSIHAQTTDPTKPVEAV